MEKTICQEDHIRCVCKNPRFFVVRTGLRCTSCGAYYVASPYESLRQQVSLSNPDASPYTLASHTLEGGKDVEEIFKEKGCPIPSTENGDTSEMEIRRLLFESLKVIERAFEPCWSVVSKLESLILRYKNNPDMVDLPDAYSLCRDQAMDALKTVHDFITRASIRVKPLAMREEETKPVPLKPGWYISFSAFPSGKDADGYSFMLPLSGYPKQDVEVARILEEYLTEERVHSDWARMFKQFFMTTGIPTHKPDMGVERYTQKLETIQKGGSHYDMSSTLWEVPEEHFPTTMVTLLGAITATDATKDLVIPLMHIKKGDRFMSSKTLALNPDDQEFNRNILGRVLIAQKDAWFEGRFQRWMVEFVLEVPPDQETTAWGQLFGTGELP